MATPVVTHKSRGTVKPPVVSGATNTAGKNTAGVKVTLSAGDFCGQCGDQGHLMSDHVVEKANQCNKCTCVAQDTDVS